MRLFLIASDVPHRNHDQNGVTAVHIVLYGLLRELVTRGHQVVLQVIFNALRSTQVLTAREEDELRHLEALGVVVLPAIYPRQYAKRRNRWRLPLRLARLLTGRGVRVEDVYVAVNLRQEMGHRVRSARADAILALWSPEGVAATYGFREVPKVAYQGDIDFVPVEVRLKDRPLFAPAGRRRVGGTIQEHLDVLRRRLGLREFKKGHLRMMRDVDVIANVTACNADFYRRHGHSGATYVRNTWIDAAAGGLRAASELGLNGVQARTIKIIGHVGYLNRTGSTYGLKFLLVDLVPALAEAMAGVEYQIHVIGGGEIAPTLRPWLRQERVVVRGYVQDLDAELRTSDVFLLLNNAGSYQAAYTRHIVAWSMGLCLVVHANSRRAIPEIQHMENALVGATPHDLANMVQLAGTDRETNLRVRKGGRQTYERYFTPAAVVDSLTREISRVVGRA